MEYVRKLADSKWNSRKLLTTVGGAIGIPLADLPPNTWGLVITFVIVQGVIDLAKMWIEYKSKGAVNG